MSCQLYLISPPTIDDLDQFIGALEKTLATHTVSVFQLRLKDVSADVIRDTAKQLLPICHKHGIQFIINDDAKLAAEIGADGVHLGESDHNYKEARALLGPHKIIGVSCYDSSDRAMELADQGADYVSFGAFFPTTTKQAKAHPSPDILTNWSKSSVVPCAAIGGITAENCQALVKAGADFIAVISYVWNHPKSPEVAVQELHAKLSIDN